MKSLLDTDITLFPYNSLSFCAKAKIDKLFGQPLRTTLSYEVEVAGNRIASVNAASLAAGNATYT